MRQIPVFVISLVRAPERRREITAHLDRIGIDYEVIDGVDGQTLSDAHMRSVTVPESGLSAGMIGCNLSHHAVYQRLLASDHDVALILEDDARIDAKIADVLRTGIDATKFDICLLDCLNRNETTPVFYDRDDRIDLLGGFRAHLLSAGPQTLHAYFISRRGAAKRVAHFFPMRQAIDTYGRDLIPLTFYAVIWPKAAWVSEHSLDSMTSKRGALDSKLPLRRLRSSPWFYEASDWIKLTRVRHLLLAKLLKAEGFLDRKRRWAPLASGRPILYR